MRRSHHYFAFVPITNNEEIEISTLSSRCLHKSAFLCSNWTVYWNQIYLPLAWISFHLHLKQFERWFITRNISLSTSFCTCVRACVVWRGLFRMRHKKTSWIRINFHCCIRSRIASCFTAFCHVVRAPTSNTFLFLFSFFFVRLHFGVSDKVTYWHYQSNDSVTWISGSLFLENDRNSEHLTISTKKDSVSVSDHSVCDLKFFSLKWSKNRKEM